MTALASTVPSSLTHLRSLASTPSDYRVVPFGIGQVDSRLNGGGLRAGALHEATAASCSLVDDAATTLFLAGVAAREAKSLGGPVLWASTRQDLYAPGLAQAGLAAADVIYANAREDADLLAVIEDAVRDGTPSAVVGEVGKLPMVATRRLQLVAAEADIPVLLLRRRRQRDHDPLSEPSAAWTRWRIASAPSERLEVAGVGRARWSVELARQRGGEGFSLIVEGCDETGRLYAPAQIVRDARDHGVEVRPPCINASRWDCTLEPTGGRYLSVRLGLRQVRGLSNADGAAIVGARGAARFESVEDVWRRSGVQRAAVEKLADADAFHAFGADRRQGLWKVRGLGEAPLPLFVAADRSAEAISAEGIEPAVSLRPLTDGREVVEDYSALQLSLRAHPLTFLRDDLSRRGVIRCADLAGIRDGRHVEVAGIILVRQKPGSAKGVLFITIEDETGVANGILWPDRFKAQRRTVMSASMIGMKGHVQKEGEVIHVICAKIIDYGDLLRGVGDRSFPHWTGRGDGAHHAGSPDRGDKGWSPSPRSCYWPPHADGMDPEDVVRVQSRNFR